MDTIIASLGIFAGAALFVGPPILLIWGLIVLLNRPGGVKQEHDFCPYIERDIFGNARIMKATFDANVAAFEEEQRPLYGRGNPAPAHVAPAPLAIEAPRALATAHQVDQTPMIDKWLAAGQIIWDAQPELPAPKAMPQLPAGNDVDGEWVDFPQPRQAVLVRRNR